MLDRLEAAFERQRQFTGDASHELRTPLAIVDLEVSRALATSRSAAEYRRALSVIRAETDYMARVMNGLLTLARADTGRVSLGRDELDLSDLALDAIERHLWLAERKRVKLEVGELPELSVLGDRILLVEMLANLIENAVKYTGGVGTRVRVSAGTGDEDAPPRARVRVEDDGPGIASEHLPRIFDRFYRVDRVRGHGIAAPAPGDDRTGHDEPRGSGLGLAIGRWIARAHGGDIRVSSVVGRGSVFEVWLPLAAARETPLAHHPPRPPSERRQPEEIPSSAEALDARAGR